MRTLPTSFILLFAMAGCTSTYQVALSPSALRPNGISYAECNERILDATIALERRSGGWVTGRNVQVASDSITFIDDRHEAPGKIATTEIRRILKVDHWAGALRGLWVGAAGMGALSWVIGITQDRGGDIVYMSPGLMLLQGVVGGGILGGIIGVISGYQETFKFDEKGSAEPVQPPAYE